jgi:predicted acylesterase/phospholipase RssA
VFNWAHWTSFYDSAPLRTTLDRYVSFERIAGSRTRLILTATDVATGRIELFDNRGATPIEAKDVLASASLPPAFPPTGIGARTFWDGGLFDNTPLTPVIKAVDADQDPQIIVVNLFPAKGSIPRNMPEVFGRAIQIMLANKIQDNVELTLEVSEYVQLVNEIKSNPGLTDAVRALPGFQRLERYKLLQNIVYITNTDAESATAFFDFSRAAIERRIASGYRDADSALNHPLRTSADAEQMRAK